MIGNKPETINASIDPNNVQLIMQMFGGVQIDQNEIKKIDFNNVPSEYQGVKDPLQWTNENVSAIDGNVFEND